MYRILILISLITCGYVFYLYFKQNKQIKSPLKHYFKNLISNCPGVNVSAEKTDKTSPLHEKMYCGSYFVTILAFGLLAFTGFLPVLFSGQHLGGLFLIIHVTLAPVLVLSVTVLILLMVHSMRFDSQDLETFKKPVKNNDGKINRRLVIKIEFWIAFVLIILAITAIILMMYPIFGESGQNKLLSLHKYSTLILFFLFQHQVYLNTKSDKRF
jgi:hypothetical protein